MLSETSSFRGTSLAFGGSTLRTVYGLDSVVHIGGGAFRNCTSLTPVNLGGSMLYTGEDAFQACSSKAFSRISVPSSVGFIGASAFYGCAGLVNVSLDCGISEIPDYCFAQCTSLTNITIPDTVVSMGFGVLQLHRHPVHRPDERGVRQEQRVPMRGRSVRVSADLS